MKFEDGMMNSNDSMRVFGWDLIWILLKFCTQVEKGFFLDPIHGSRNLCEKTIEFNLKTIRTEKLEDIYIVIGVTELSFLMNKKNQNLWVTYSSYYIKNFYCLPVIIVIHHPHCDNLSTNDP